MDSWVALIHGQLPRCSESIRVKLLLHTHAPPYTTGGNCRFYRTTSPISATDFIDAVPASTCSAGTLACQNEPRCVALPSREACR